MCTSRTIYLFNFIFTLIILIIDQTSCLAVYCRLLLLQNFWMLASFCVLTHFNTWWSCDLKIFKLIELFPLIWLDPSGQDPILKSNLLRNDLDECQGSIFRRCVVRLHLLEKKFIATWRLRSEATASLVARLIKDGLKRQ